jgi:hypothetical protein
MTSSEMGGENRSDSFWTQINKAISTMQKTLISSFVSLTKHISTYEVIIQYCAIILYEDVSIFEVSDNLS